METRYQSSPIESKEPRRIAGYAARYNMPTEIADIRGRKFIEMLRPGAFRSSIERGDDVRCLRDHNPSILFGRTKSGTLRLSEDSQGLRFDVELPETSEAFNVIQSIKRGDIDGCSFAFETLADHWGERGGQPVREINDVRLFDVSLVTYPAYDFHAGLDLRSVYKPRHSTKILRARLHLIEID